MTHFVGRLQERQVLRAALGERGPRLLIVRGPSGVGKTALVEQALQEMTALAAPIVGRAKYAEQTTSAGLRPVVDALSQAVDAALGRLYDPAAGAASLSVLLGAQYDTLAAAGFAAAGLAGTAASGSASPPLQSRDGTARLVDALARVLQWLEGFALPVVLFVDDWHRAPNEAVGFVQACSRRGEASTLKLVLAQRSEGAMAYPASASIVELAPLDGARQLELLTLLLGEPARAQAVRDWLGEQASGLPFDLTEIALALERAHAFAGSGEALHVDAARAGMIDQRDLNRVIVQRAQALPAAVLRLGIAAALWGDRTDLATLAVCLGETVQAARWAAELLQSNGLLRIEDDEVAFPHDRVRASLLQVPGAPELNRLAHAMADILLVEEGGPHRQTALRLKLMGGIDTAGDAHLALLFAGGADQARRAAQFDLAAEFGEASWSILRASGAAEPATRVAVLREAIFAAAHRRDAGATRERCRLMIAAANGNAVELAAAYERGVVAMRLAGTSADAWALCREGFARFGIRLPQRMGEVRLRLSALPWRLFGRKPRRLLAPDRKKMEALTSFANAAGYTVWERSPYLAAYLSIRIATRARLMGLDSALWRSMEVVVSAVLRDYRAAAALADQALAGLDDLQMGRGTTLQRAVFFGKMWRDPRASLIATNRLQYDYCLAENDLVTAANAVMNEAIWSWRSAPTLGELAVKIEEADEKAQRLGDARIGGEIAVLAELVRRLRRPEKLSTEDLEAFIKGKIFDVPSTTVEFLAVAGDWPAVLRLADAHRGRRSGFDAYPAGPAWRFFENLARLKTGLALDRRDLRSIARAARANPVDQLGKLLLLRAEHAQCRGKADCLILYAQAIEAMRKGSSQLELGLAAECAAEAARELGYGAEHARYRNLAAATWSAWGAFGKLATYDTTQLDANSRGRLAEAEAQVAMARRGERAKSRFLAEVGHELRTPLQAMQGLLDLATERPDEVDLREMREVFGSLKSVVDNLTELGALGAEAPLNLRTTDLSALLGSELALAQEAARAKGLVLSADTAAIDGQTFEIDADRLRQAVRNLLWNAVKYTDRGSVLLQARLGDGSDGKTYIALSVEDGGPGIPQERLPHLFEPFDRAGRRDSNGLGLGLSLSRRVAERMGGALTAENRSEGGARFVFSFLADKRPASVAPTVPPTVARPLTILIVEDTTLVRRLMTRLLALDGHEVIQAEDLGQALEQARQHKVDLLLLDLHLPDGDGLSLLARWPAERERPPVIVLTASVTRETEERVARAGATVLRKPIASAALRAAIARACGNIAPPEPPNGFGDEMASLTRDALVEIANRTIELIDLLRAEASREKIRQQAHKLAGLAAQFHETDIAKAADRIESASARLSIEDLGELERRARLLLASPVPSISHSIGRMA